MSYFWSSCLSSTRYFSSSYFFFVVTSFFMRLSAYNQHLKPKILTSYWACCAIFLSKRSVSILSFSMVILSLQNASIVSTILFLYSFFCAQVSRNSFFSSSSLFFSKSDASLYTFWHRRTCWALRLYISDFCWLRSSSSKRFSRIWFSFCSRWAWRSSLRCSCSLLRALVLFS